MAKPIKQNLPGGQLKVTNPGIVAISPYLPGLNIAGVLNVADLSHARNAIEISIMQKSLKFYIPMPQEAKKLLSLYSGTHRKLEQAKILNNANRLTAMKMEHEYGSYGTRDGFNWCSDEGLSILLPIIQNAEGWVTLELEISGAVSAEMVDGLSRIRNAAKNSGVWVMLFLVCGEGYEKTRIHNLCEDFLEIASCEPDIGWVKAFSIDYISLRYLNALGIGKAMCRVKISEGVFQHRYSPFVSASLETRVMWVMRGEGETLEAIGNRMKKDKTTVLRRLQGLPSPRKSETGKKYLKSYFELSGCNDLSDELDADD